MVAVLCLCDFRLYLVDALGKKSKRKGQRKNKVSKKVPGRGLLK